MTLKVYRSSAGSGKTFTLALEYLSLALKSPLHFRYILGVTFTNKAANEMKARILKFLKVLSDPHHPEAGLRKILLTHLTALGHGDHSNIEKKALGVFHHILHNYGDFAISTIDAFVYKIVRIFSRDVALPSQFELILDTDDIIERLTDRLFDKLGYDQVLTEQLITFLLEQIEEEDNFSIEKTIKGFCQELLSERAYPHARFLANLTDEVFMDIKLKARHELNSHINELIQIVGNILHLLAAAQIPPTDMIHGASGVGGQLEKLYRTKDFIDFFSRKRVQDAIENQVFFKAADNLRYAQLLDGLKTHFGQMGVWYNNSYQRARFLKLLLSNLDTLSLTSKLFAETEQLIAEEQIVHISEFNKRISELLITSGVPYIYERLGERYRHFLLDEFQDTSVLQWSNFLPLIENGLSAGYDSLIVGDAKQAIYRWRNGEVEQFIILPEVMGLPGIVQPQSYGQTLRNHYAPFELKVNYRSQPEIVKFNNRFFTSLASALPEKYREIFADCQQEVGSGGKGYVSISLLDENLNQKPNELALDKMITFIKSALHDGYIPADVAVICRTNNQCRVVAERLSAEAFRFVSADSLKLNSSPAVKAIVAAMRSITEGNQPIFNLTMQAGMFAHKGEHQAIAEVILPDGHYLKPPFELSEIADSGGTSLYALTEEVIRNLGLQQPYDPFVQSFLDALLAFQNNTGESLSAFVRYWEESLSKSSIALPEDENSLSVLTVHKAKGLEYPVVIIPFAEFSKAPDGKNQIWVSLADDHFPPLKSLLLPVKSIKDGDFEREYQEEKNKALLDLANITYVAYTRAKDRLHLIMPKTKTSNNFTIFERMKQFLLEQGLWEEQRLEYTFGEMFQPSIKETTKQVYIEEQIMPSARFILEPETLLASVSNLNQKRSLGIHVHDIFSAIKYLHEAEYIINRSLEDGLLSPVQAKKLLQWFKAVTAHPELSWCYQPDTRVFNEMAFADGQGKVFRVDRYCEQGERRAIIEYKTGERSTHHLTQLRNYTKNASAIEGVNVEGFLVYLDDELDIVKV